MVRTCCVRGCRVNNKNKPDGVQFASFPKDERAQKWIDEVRKVKGSDWLPSPSTLICTLHFDSKYYYKDPLRKSMLVPGAIPQISELPPPSSIVKVRNTNLPGILYRLKNDDSPVEKALTDSPCVVEGGVHGSKENSVALASHHGEDVQQSGIVQEHSENDVPLSTPRGPRKALQDVSNSNLQLSNSLSKNRLNFVPRTPPAKVALTANSLPPMNGPSMLKSPLPSQRASPYSTPSRKRTHPATPAKAGTPSIPVCLDVLDDDSPREKVLKAYIDDLHARLDQMRDSYKQLEGEYVKCKGVIAQKDKEVRAMQLLLQKVRINNNCKDSVTVVKDEVSEETYMMLRRLVGEDWGTYEPLLKSFALTVHFYSPAAYEYVRAKLNNRLPHADTIRRWYAKVGGDPGFTVESLDHVKAFAAQQADLGSSLPVVLIVDDMKIKKHVRMVQKKPVGLINYGGILDETTGLEKQPVGHLEDESSVALDLEDESEDDDGLLDGELADIEIEDEVESADQYGELDELEFLSPDEKTAPLATDACVFMIVFLGLRLKLPIGYFLHKGLKGQMLAILVKHALYLLHEANAQVMAIITDGHNANFNMATLLGARLRVKVYRRKGANPSVGSHVNWEEYDTGIPDPHDPSRTINFLPDVCHMLKLVRNTLALWGVLIDVHGKRISWRFIEELVKYQSSIGLKFCNKLTRVHVEWCRQKMKTKFAAQTLSNSVADALEFLEFTLGVAEFRGASATARFCRVFNDLFDVLNSRTKFGKDLKAPLKLANEAQWKKVFRYSETYIKGLKNEDGQSVFNTRREKAFRGLLLAIHAVEAVFDATVRYGKMGFLLTYKLSQDALEMFFGLIRQMGGCNDNPTVSQFSAAYKRSMFRNEVKASKHGNAVPLESIKVLSAMSTQPRIEKSATGGSERVDWTAVDWDEVDAFQRLFKFTSFRLGTTVDCIVTFLSGFVAMQMFRACLCLDCSTALIAKDQFTSGDVYGFVEFKSMRIERVPPTTDVLKICRLAEVAVRRTQANGLGLVGVSRHRSLAALTACKEALEMKVFECLDYHVVELGHLVDHIPSLIKDIFERYWTLRVHHLCRTLNDEAMKGSRRQQNAKETHFRNE